MVTHSATSPVKSDQSAPDWDDLAAGLQELRLAAGMSYRELHRRVARLRRARGILERPAYDTVYRCLQPGRARLDVDLVGDIVAVLGQAPEVVAAWRRRCADVARGRLEAAPVEATGLPGRLPRFVGRSRELAGLLRLQAGGLALVTGMAGIGKTSLAVEAGHRMLAAGVVEQAYVVDLHGADPDRVPADRGAVVGALLRALGVAAAAVARAEPRRRLELLAAAVQGRRVLLVLDDVADESGLSGWLPLLDARVVLTSRRRVEVTGAALVELAPLAPAESRALLTAGLDRPDPGAADRLAELAGHLPLALALARSRITARPEWSLADHAEQVAELQREHRIDTGLSADLTLSYRSLTPSQARLLRLLAAAPIVDADTDTAAALTALPAPDAAALLAALVDAHLILPVRSGHWGLHDLVRVFATARAQEVDAPSARRAAVDRLLDLQAVVTGRAMARYSPHEVHRQPPLPDASGGGRFADRAEATGWLESELGNLLAAVSATAQRRGDHAIRMSFLLFRYLDLNGRFEDAEKLHRRAAAAAPSGTDRARALNQLGITAWSAGRLDAAGPTLRSALAEYGTAGDQHGVRMVLGNLGGVAWARGDFTDAVEFGERTLTLAEAADDRAAQAVAHNNLGAAYERLNDLTASAFHHHRTLELDRELGDLVGAGRALSNLAEVFERQGRDADARALQQEALAIAREAHHELGAADALNHLATLDSRAGRHEVAVRGHRTALGLARANFHPESEVEVLNDLAATLLRAGRTTEARTVAEEALAGARACGDPHAEGRALTTLGRR